VSNSDSFIDEVTEDLRRDRLFGLMRRYGWIAVIAILVLVGGAAWNEWQKVQRQAAAETAGTSLLAALRQPDAGARAAAISALEVRGGEAAAVLLIEAASLVEAGDAAAADARLRTVADDPAHPRVWRDLAALKRVMIAGSALAAADRAAVLDALAAPGAPFRILALEQRALALVAAGDRDGAITVLEDLMVDQESSPEVRVRSAQILVALGAAGEAGQ
jgi:hypothetical protein